MSQLCVKEELDNLEAVGLFQPLLDFQIPLLSTRTGIGPFEVNTRAAQLLWATF